jgi:hypothetical protein
MSNVLKDIAKATGVGLLADKLGLTGGNDSLKMMGAESVMPGSAVGKAAGMKKGGSVSSASKRADGIATKGKTRGRMV